MNYKVYRLSVKVTYYSLDEDMCPSYEEVTEFEDFYSSKKEAIRIAQRKFARLQLVEGYVFDVHALVLSAVIGEKGMGHRKKIYSLFKTL